MVFLLPPFAATMAALARAPRRRPLSAPPALGLRWAVRVVGFRRRDDCTERRPRQLKNEAQFRTHVRPPPRLACPDGRRSQQEPIKSLLVARPNVSLEPSI